MQYSELPVGAKFRFFRHGMLLTKVSKYTYTAPTGHAEKSVPDAEVLPQDEGRFTTIARLARGSLSWHARRVRAP
jgi:hypothetical protein